MHTLVFIVSLSIVFKEIHENMFGKHADKSKFKNYLNINNKLNDTKRPKIRGIL